MKYLVKKISDTNYKVLYITDAKHRPRGGEYLFIEAPKFEFPKVSIDQNGKLSIVEDTTIKTKKDKQRKFKKDIALMKKRLDFGVELSAMILFLADSRLNTIAKKKKVLQLYSELINTLNLGLIDVAKDIISKATPDGVVMLAKNKSDILAEIDLNLEELGYGKP